MECFFPEPAARRGRSFAAAAGRFGAARDGVAATDGLAATDGVAVTDGVAATGGLAAPDALTATRRRRTVRRGLVAGGAILAAAVGLLGWRAARGGARELPTSAAASAAVARHAPASLTARR
jgi:hypothetical protein